MRMIKRVLFFLIPFAFLCSLFFLLDYAGSLTSFSANSKRFFKNIYHAQEQGQVNASLEGEVITLKKTIYGLERVRNENEILRAYLKLSPSPKRYSLIIADVIGKGFAFGSQTIIIHAGKQQGITKGDAVVMSLHGLQDSEYTLFIGNVINVLTQRAYVQLVSDVAFSMKAITDREARGIVKGTIGGQVVFDEVRQGIFLEKGSLIMTANDNPQVPEGLVIGEVNSIISRPTDIVQKASVKLLFDPYLLNRVGIVKAD